MQGRGTQELKSDLSGQGKQNSTPNWDFWIRVTEKGKPQRKTFQKSVWKHSLGPRLNPGLCEHSTRL